MEKNLQFSDNLKNIENQQNLLDLPSELLELILVELWNKQPEHAFDKSTLKTPIIFPL